MHDRLAFPAGALRALKVGTVAMVVTGLVLVAVLVAGPHLFSSGSGRLRPGPGGLRNGEAEGWVRSAESSTGIIRVSSGFLGLSSFALVVTPDTLITVGGKEGGFDDMYEGRWVRAAYEERQNGALAKSIEVVVDGVRAEHRQPIGQPGGGPADAGLRPDASTGGPVGDAPGVLARPPLAPSPAVAPGVASREVAPVAGTRATKRQTDPRIELQAPGGPPSTRRSVAAGEPPADNRRSSPPSDPWGDGATQARAVEPHQTQETDPAAVIDWLLQRSPPRSP